MAPWRPQGLPPTGRGCLSLPLPALSVSDAPGAGRRQIQGRMKHSSGPGRLQAQVASGAGAQAGRRAPGSPVTRAGGLCRPEGATQGLVGGELEAGSVAGEADLGATQCRQ